MPADERRSLLDKLEPNWRRRHSADKIPPPAHRSDGSAHHSQKQDLHSGEKLVSNQLEILDQPQRGGSSFSSSTSLSSSAVRAAGARASSRLVASLGLCWSLVVALPLILGT